MHTVHIVTVRTAIKIEDRNAFMNYLKFARISNLLCEYVCIQLQKTRLCLQTMSIPKALLVKSVHLAGILAKLPGSYINHTQPATYLHT